MTPVVASQTTGHPIWDVDLFDNSTSTIKAMKAKSTRVICYFSADSFEEERSNAKKWTKANHGNTFDG